MTLTVPHMNLERRCIVLRTHMETHWRGRDLQTKLHAACSHVRSQARCLLTVLTVGPSYGTCDFGKII
jgi:hypothetical protein